MKALISTFDKTGLVELASHLARFKYQIVSTGQTAKFLTDNGFSVRDVSNVTGFGEILDGRVKTLHPKIHAAILARPNLAQDCEALKRLEVEPFDLIVVNFYPFEKTPSIENIDIGGPTMVRAAAKNHEFVTVLTQPGDYGAFAKELANLGQTTPEFRKKMAKKAFARVAQYDLAVAEYFGQELRYGENPHQKAVVIENDADELSLVRHPPLQGKELSYNNLLDADAAIFALRCLIDGKNTSECGTVIVKHGTPCGAAIAANAGASLSLAISCDPTSAFGGIIAMTHEISEETATQICDSFFEVVIAPGFSKTAVSLFSQKKNLRLISLPNLMTASLPQVATRSVAGALLRQSHDQPYSQIKNAQIVTQRKPTEDEYKAMDLAFRCSIGAKSNAIALASPSELISIASGHTSRVEAVKMALTKMSPRAVAIGSDAFFPFADSIELAAMAGISAIAQPGGSIRDAEVIEMANRYNLTMVFTGERHFRH